MISLAWFIQLGQPVEWVRDSILVADMVMFSSKVSNWIEIQVLYFLSGSRTSETGSELSQSISSLDRDDEDNRTRSVSNLRSDSVGYEEIFGSLDFVRVE